MSRASSAKSVRNLSLPVEVEVVMWVGLNFWSCMILSEENIKLHLKLFMEIKIQSDNNKDVSKLLGLKIAEVKKESKRLVKLMCSKSGGEKEEREFDRDNVDVYDLIKGGLIQVRGGVAVVLWLR